MTVELLLGVYAAGPIYILDLMHGDSQPREGVKALDLKKELDANGLDSTVLPSGTRAELFAALEKVRKKLSERGMPFIHFFGHGEKEGIELYNGGRKELVSWADLDGLVSPVAARKNGVVVLCFDTFTGLRRLTCIVSREFGHSWPSWGQMSRLSRENRLERFVPSMKATSATTFSLRTKIKFR